MPINFEIFYCCPMHKLASEILDVQDDEGLLISKTWKTLDEVPKAIKCANLSPPKNHQYALDIDGFKKFAMHDEGNILLSLLYFSTNKDKLPEDLQKEAAAELMTNITRIKDPIPKELKEMADKLRSQGVEVVTRERNWRTYDNLGNVMDDTGDCDAGRTLANKQQFKPEDRDSSFDNAARSRFDTEKTASTNYKLMDFYPINTFDQVKTACDYFKDNWREFSPKERHEYCTKLASRMEDLAMEIPYEISKLGSAKYANDCEIHTLHRKQFVHENEWPILMSLVEKIAQVEPETYAEALETFDKEFQLERFWDSQLTDPYRTTFGMDKKAETEWRYNYRDVYISEENLNKLMLHDVKPILGSEIAQRFIFAPKKEFMKLDNDKKFIIARLAMENQVA